MNLFLAHIQQDNALISNEEAHHLKKVLRKNVGDQILVTDGLGNLFSGEIIAIETKNVVISNLKEFENKQKRSYHLEVAIAPTKQIDRTAFFLEKAIEVGLDAIHPIITFHSERRKINQERLERVGLSAMKQSLKGEKTKVNELIKFDDLIAKYKDFEGQKFIAHCDDTIEKTSLKEALTLNGSYIFLIGPEGDFSKAEIEKAIQYGFKSITLGNQRMRTETAALSTVMAVHWAHQ
ncbi:RsmE family RNA methyltransferase [Flavobacteriaceae bacterium Ap0902]|nr:RsmE family RNA methyltransferase [Flavobacteriaceae bacterium Ap0902]